MNADVATVVAAGAFTVLLMLLVVRGAGQSASHNRGRAAAWSTWGAVPVALAGVLAVLFVDATTVSAWTALCFGLYVIWASGQVAVIARSKTLDRAWPRYVDLALVSAACVTITLFPMIAD